MSALRVLLIGTETPNTQQICSSLERANHRVFPVPGFSEASEALLLQRFEAVLLTSAVDRGEAQEFLAELRSRERARRAPDRVPVVALLPAPAEDLADAVLPGEFEPARFAQTVESLASAVAAPGENGASPLDGLAILNAADFEEQVAFDHELMVEIIDLFLFEYPGDLQSMSEALAAGDFDRLMRAAHTIKGSLGSLHAEVARHHSQALETVAKLKDFQACATLLGQLEADLSALSPQLLSLRHSVSPAGGTAH